MNTNKSKKIDMTRGPIMRNVFLFAIPIVIGNILQQLYTTVDTLVIGNFGGSTSLAAVGTSSQPVEVLLCVFLGIGTGVSILISQYAGAQNEEKIKDTAATAISFVFLCGIPVTVLGWIYAPYILEFMGVPEDTWTAALYYTRFVFLGTLGNIGYNMNAGILRGLGDSKASLWFLVVACITNIILDIYLVAGLRMDVVGAAIATSVAMFVSWITSILYIRKKFPELSFTFLPRRIVGEEMSRIIRIGLPIGLNNSLFSFGHVALQTMVNAQGSTFMAGHSVAGRITGLSNIAITGMSSAATTFAGQNFGAKNYRRLKEGHLRIPLVSGLITLAFGLFFINIRMPILRFFNKEDMVLMYASRYVVVTLMGQWMYAVFNGVSCIIQGTGRVKYTTIINLMMLWVVRVPVAYLITQYYDGTWVMLCFPASFFFGMMCMLAYYVFSKRWHELMALAREEEKSIQQADVELKYM
ncbi:MAG: MATE family efflux transporter [Lachnospiraceae bacterium]|nr:MATE family efflux transporter [Lachnospiraceae bacterium]